MMMAKRVWLAGLCASGLLMACGGSGGTMTTPPPADASTPTDMGSNPTDTPSGTDAPVGQDTPRTDVVGGDVVRTDTAPVDRPPPVDPCMSARDVSMTMPGSDGAVHVMGDSTTAPTTMLGSLPDTCTSGGEKGRPVVFRYTMRTTALLRVSTVNMGTDAMLDTIVAVLPTCAQLATPIACNDDVARGNVRSTATTAMPVMAGTTVFVVVGNYGATAEDAEGGPFELSIRELSPIPAGMPCRAGDVCATGATCLNVGDPVIGQCVNDGSMGGLCRTAMGAMACDMGFTCSQAMPTATMPGTCRTLVANGMPCDRTGRSIGCMTGAACLPSATDASMYVCTPNGARGGNCRVDSPRCDMGLECSSGTPGTCREIITMMGAACDLAGRTSVCGTGLSCAPNAMLTAGSCVAVGTVAGAACRADGTRCDGMLTCSAAAGMPGVCRATVPAGMACDTRYNSTVCAAMSYCVPSSATAATCRAAVPETEPNNTPMMPQAAVSMSTVYSGALAMGSDVDCFGVTVPAMASLFLETNFPTAPTCPIGTAMMPNPDTIVTLYNPAGMQIAENDDSRGGVCSQIDPATTMAARGLAAGNYTVCVRGYGAMPVAIPSYTLTIGIQAP